MTDKTITILKTAALGPTISAEMVARSLRLIPRTGDLIDRRDLTEPHEIIERMARDILAARREGVAGLVDLTEHGWTQAQATRWGCAARDLAASPGFAAQDVVERLRASEEAGEAAVTLALASCFDAPAPADPITGDMATMVDDLATPQGDRA